jgi:hypothetical protein
MWPIAGDDSMTVGPGNRPSPYGDWQFGLRKIRMAELVRCFAAICMEMGGLVVATVLRRTQGSRQIAPPKLVEAWADGRPARQYQSCYCNEFCYFHRSLRAKCDEIESRDMQQPPMYVAAQSQVPNEYRPVQTIREVLLPQ